jgi:tetratricopeptide (TPR) repeat protein
METAERMYGRGDEVIDLLARHAYLGETGAKAIDYLSQAGDRSRRIFANDQAIVHFRRAVEVAEKDVTEEVPGLKLALAELEDLVGEFEEAARLYDEVRSATCDVEAWKGLASIARRRGDAEGALQLIDEAFFTETLASKDLAPLWVERAKALINEGRYLDAVDATEAGLAAIDRPESAIAGELLLQQARAETSIDRLDDALAQAGEALRVFETLGEVRGQTSALRVLGGAHINAGMHENAVQVLRRALPLAERTGSIEEIMGCLVNLGLAEMFTGDLDPALAHSRRALEEAERIGHTQGQAIVSVNIADILLNRGELDEASVVCGQGMRMAVDVGNNWTLADGQRVMASIFLRQARYADALEWAEKATGLFLELGGNAYAAVALEVAADAATHEGDAERARSFVERARSLTGA